ncbi:hypothetical protein [Mariluticola halotolerans]|uniref:hypothetical protein n=1 Tax=Mariluticola halotolerans TaxID=2909283 RepID=UPI0026E2BD33|nr:hypothetical protein [Mariluticola halotolerans]UJQ93413.1 hypothetical protein L1P08_10450 [Mariluticola halotolerans]
MRRIVTFHVYGILALSLVGMGHAAGGEAGRTDPWSAESRYFPGTAGMPEKPIKPNWEAGPDSVIHADLLGAMQCLAPAHIETVDGTRHFHRSWPYFDTSRRPHVNTAPPIPPRATPVVVRIVWQNKTRRRGMH